MAASRKRWTRLSARMRAESNERATACSRRLSLAGSAVSAASFVVRHPAKSVPARCRTQCISAHGGAPGHAGTNHILVPAIGGPLTTAGSTSMSMLAAPLSGTRGWRHTSTGNETLTSE